MPIDVGCDLDRGVTHLFFHVAKAKTCTNLNEMGRVAVAKRMESDSPQPGALNAREEVPMVDIHSIQCASRRRRKHQTRNLGLAALETLDGCCVPQIDEYTPQIATHVHAARLVAFRRGEFAKAVVPSDQNVAVGIVIARAELDIIPLWG